jgi:hypothetical protein
MNLSIAKATNKHTVFKMDGILESLLTVTKRASPRPSFHRNSTNVETRIKAYSALSYLAIGYEHKIPMFAYYPGFVDSILQVIDTDSGEVRTKACSILWSFAAEMRNQVLVGMSVAKRCLHRCEGPSLPLESEMKVAQVQLQMTIKLVSKTSGVSYALVNVHGR